MIHMCDPDNDRFIMDLCPHDPEIIKEMVIKKQKIIKSAKPGYEDPAGLKKPKITPAEKAKTRDKVERMIGGFQAA